MFGTWKLDCDRGASRPARYASAAETIQASKKPTIHLACDSCRAKKLKCSGESGGCSRCRSLDSACTYPSNHDGRKKRRNNGQTVDSRPSNATSAGTPKATHKQAQSVELALDDGLQFSPPHTEALGERLTESATQPGGWPMFPEPADFGFDGLTPPDDPVNWSTMLEDFREGAPSADANAILQADGLGDVVGLPIPRSTSNNNNVLGDIYELDLDLPLSSAAITESRLSTSDMHETPEIDVQSNLPPLARHRSASVTQDLQSRDTPSRPGSADQNNEDNCRCLQMCARLIDQLSIRTSITAPLRATLDKLIGLYKASAREVLSFHQCSACARRSENMMLIAVVIQHMCTLCEQMVQTHLQKSGAAGLELRFGQVQITNESEVEPLCLAMISSQCKDFAMLLSTLKAKAVLMPGPMVMLQSAIDRLACLRRVIEDVAERSE